jgi:hypothetical protein
MALKKQTKVKSNSALKAALYKLQLFDGLWSIPLAFAVFVIAGAVSVEHFNDAIISTEYLQYVALAAVIMVIANFVIFLGIRFNFRELQRQVYSKEMKQDFRNSLTTWQKLLLYFGVYFFFFASFLIIVYMLMTATA